MIVMFVNLVGKLLMVDWAWYSVKEIDGFFIVGTVTKKHR